MGKKEQTAKRGFAVDENGAETQHRFGFRLSYNRAINLKVKAGEGTGPDMNPELFGSVC